jgi:xylitol oxidase
VFTNWENERANQVWLKRRVDDGEVHQAARTVFGATLVTEDRHPLVGISAENCTTQRGVPGPWHERLPHFRMNYTPSSGAELQSEYFVPRPNAEAALAAVRGLRDIVTPVLLVSELRTIAADELWMSPCFGQACLGIHFTWKPDWPGVSKVLPKIESALSPLGARPHWGKMFTMAPSHLKSLYSKLPEFCRLASEFDPSGKFRNAFLDRYIY